MIKMSSAKARQEARRRKILENADKRMQILTNQYEKENVTAEIKDSEVTDTSSNAIREEIFRARLNEKDHLQDETSGDVDKMVQSKDPEKTNPVQQKVELENLSVQENIEKEAANYSVDSSKKDGVFHKELRHRGTVKIQKNVEPPKAETSNNVNVVQSENSDSDISFGVKQLEGLKIASLVLLALVCRLVLKLGIGVMYFQSIFLPFVAIEVLWIQYQMKNSLHTPRKRNMMSTVLMLCGIKQNLLAVYDGVMNQVATFSEDFGLFVFSFFISNFLVS